MTWNSTNCVENPFFIYFLYQVWLDLTERMANIENAAAADSTTPSPPPSSSNNAKSANFNDENLDEKISAQQEEIEKQVKKTNSHL